VDELNRQYVGLPWLVPKVVIRIHYPWNKPDYKTFCIIVYTLLSSLHHKYGTEQQKDISGNNDFGYLLFRQSGRIHKTKWAMYCKDEK